MNQFVLHVMPFIYLSVWFLPATQISAQTAAPSRTIYATPKGGKVQVKGKAFQSEELNTAIRKARSGDRVILLPGTYTERLEISKNADPENPITILGEDDLTTFTCNDLPATKGKAAITVSGAKGLIFRGIRFSSCWPHAIAIKDSEFITIKENHFENSYQPIAISFRLSHHIIVEQNSWIGPLERSQKNLPEGMFTESSLVVSKNSGGDFLIRDNRISTAGALLIVDHDDSGKNATTTNIFVQRNKATSLSRSLVILNHSSENLWLQDNILADSTSLLEVNNQLQGTIVIFSNLFENKNMVASNILTSGLKNNLPIKGELFILHNNFRCVDQITNLNKDTSIISVFQKNAFTPCPNQKLPPAFTKLQTKKSTSRILNIKKRILLELDSSAPAGYFAPNSELEGYFPTSAKAPYRDYYRFLGLKAEVNSPQLKLIFSRPLDSKINIHSVSIENHTDNPTLIQSRQCRVTSGYLLCQMDQAITKPLLHALIRIEAEEGTPISSWGSSFESSQIAFVRPQKN